jgi:hypothetical protein
LLQISILSCSGFLSSLLPSLFLYSFFFLFLYFFLVSFVLIGLEGVGCMHGELKKGVIFYFAFSLVFFYLVGGILITLRGIMEFKREGVQHSFLCVYISWSQCGGGLGVCIYILRVHAGQRFYENRPRGTNLTQRHFQNRCHYVIQCKCKPRKKKGGSQSATLAKQTFSTVLGFTCPGQAIS